MSENGITHLTTAPYFPATNGQAERFVQTIKKALTAAKVESDSIQLKLSRFLLAYRNAPHALFNKSPAMLFLKRRLKTRLDLIQPKSEEVAKHKILKQIESDKGREPIKFKVNQKVATLDHRYNDKKWVVGTIDSVLGHLMYTVRIAKDVAWKRHHNQTIPMPDEDSSLTDVPLPQIIDNEILQGTTPTSQGQNEDSEANSQNDEIRQYPSRIRQPLDRYNAADYF